MDKNSIIGIILMCAVMFGFTFIQQKKYTEQAAIQAQLDSAARAEYLQQAALDSLNAIEAGEGVGTAANAAGTVTAYYKDSCLQAASAELSSKESIVTLDNGKVSVSITTRGAQPCEAVIADYFTSDSTELSLWRRNEYAVSVYTGEYIRTSDFNFVIAEQTSSMVAMRLPFAGGGYIEQRYSLDEDSYMVHNTLSFVGMEEVIPKNVSSIDIDYSMLIPRMEKGYKNESQYSKLNYYFGDEKKVSELGRGRNASKDVNAKLSWFAFQQQFFCAIFRAHDSYQNGSFSIEFASQDDPERNLMACGAKMRCDLPKDNPSDMSLDFDIYFGPNHLPTLKSYDRKYEKIIPLGGSLVGWFTKWVIIPLFNFFHRFIDNFGIIILLMTLVIKLVVFPLTYKSLASSAKMNALRPEMEKINEKYPKQEDAMKKQQATMDLYKKAGVSPMGGCLPMLLTFPILWAMFRFFPASIELRQQPFLWCQDLSAYDAFIDFGRRIPIFGDHISLFALLMAVTMFFYSKITTSSQPGNDPNAASMKFMSVWMMPIMMYFICNSLSAALSYYYLLSQLISIVETMLIRKYAVHPEQLLEKVRNAENKPVRKSKWQLRLEEAQKMQQAQLKAQQKASSSKNRR